MKRTFLRIIFLVFLFISFGLVNSSFHSDLGKNNQTKKTEGNGKKTGTKNEIAENDESRFKLQGARKTEATYDLHTRIEKFKEELHKEMKLLKEIKETLDGIHIVLGDSFSKLVYYNESATRVKVKNLNVPDYEFYLNNFYNLFKKKWGYIRIMEKTNSSIYSKLLNRNEELSELIVTSRFIRDDARRQYDEYIKSMKEAIDLINHNRSKDKSIRDYLRFIIKQSYPVPDYSKVQLKTLDQLKSSAKFKSLSVQEFDNQVGNKHEAFSIRELLLFGAILFTIVGVVIYFILKKKK